MTESLSTAPKQTVKPSEQALMLEHTVLVKRIAHHLLLRLPPNVNLDDLIQAGMLGLLEAIRNFDPNRGASFETYAGIRIRGNMLDDVRKGDWTPRSVHRNARRISDAIQAIERRTGSDASDRDIARELGVEMDDYFRMLNDSRSARLFGFDDLGVSEDAIPWEGNQDDKDPSCEVEKEKFKAELVRLLETLPEREQLVLSLYYDEELNLKEIGEVLGVSESRVCQIHSQSMARLRARLSEPQI